MAAVKTKVLLDKPNTLHYTVPTMMQVRRVAAIIRAARKQLGLTQAQMAARLGSSQSNISKYERGLLVPGILDCIEISKAAGIELESFNHGFISTGSEVGAGGFSLPERYRTSAEGTRVRASLGLLRAFEHFFSKEHLKVWLECNRIDEDYFVFHDHKLSFQFCLDMLRQFMKSRTRAEALGFHLAQYYSNIQWPRNSTLSSPMAEAIQAIRSTVLHASLLEDNFNYSIVNETKRTVDLKVTPNPGLSPFRFGDVEPLLSSVRKTIIPKVGQLSRHKIAVRQLETTSQEGGTCLYQLVMQ